MKYSGNPKRRTETFFFFTCFFSGVVYEELCQKEKKSKAKNYIYMIQSWRQLKEEKKQRKVVFLFLNNRATKSTKEKGVTCAQLHGLLVPATSHSPKRRDTSVPPRVIINTCDNFSVGRSSSAYTLFDTDLRFLQAIGLQLPTEEAES